MLRLLDIDLHQIGCRQTSADKIIDGCGRGNNRLTHPIFALQTERIICVRDAP